MAPHEGQDKTRPLLGSLRFRDSGPKLKVPYNGASRPRSFARLPQLGGPSHLPLQSTLSLWGGTPRALGQGFPEPSAFPELGPSVTKGRSYVLSKQLT